MKKYLLQVLLVMLCTLMQLHLLPAQSNRHKLDSLLNTLNSSKHDSVKAINLVKISKEYWSFQVDSAHFYCDKGISLSKKINYNTGLRFALKIKGGLYLSQSLYDSALVYYNLLKQECTGASYQVCLLEFYSNAAACYEGKGNFTMSLDYFLRVAKTAEAINDIRRWCNAYINISSNYRVHMMDYVSAYSYALKAVELSEKTDELELKGTSNERAASALADMGRLDSAMYYAKRSLQYYQELTSCPDCMVGQYVVIADIYLKLNQPDSALVYSNKAVDLGKDLTQQEYYADALFKLGKSLAAKGQQQAAVNAINSGLVITGELEERYDLKYLAYEAFVYIYEKGSDYKNLSLYKDSLFKLEDSLNSVEVTNNLNNLKLKYETDKKENEIAKLSSDKKIQQLLLEKQKAVITGNIAEAKQKQQEIDLLNQQQQIQELKMAQQHEQLALKELESKTKDRQLKVTEQEKQLQQTELKQQQFSNNIILTGAVATLAFGALGFNIYRINTKRKNETEKFRLQNQLSEMKLEALRSQMNPHFIFNALNSINRYIVRSDKETASEYLVKFSKLMRLILENSRSSFIPLSNELEALRLYVEMELLRFDNKFDFNISVAAEVMQQKTQIPPMVLQPFIENAIWHGLMNKKEKGNISVKVDALTRDQLLIVIEDNGVGRKKAAIIKENDPHTHKSFGVQITRDRIAALNGDHKKFRIIDLFDKDNNPAGTRIEIEINIQAA